MQIRSRAPLRLGFAGGGTDVSPYCDIYGGLVMNATIDMYAYANIAVDGERRVRFVAKDKQESVEYPLAGRLELDGTLDIHKGVYNRIVRQFNQGEPIALTLTTFSDAPAGSGLGSSSTLVVAMVKGFVELLNLPLGEYDIAQLAYQIEREDVGLNGGRQDQYAATFGGFNFMEFHADNRVIVNPLRIKNWIISELESSIVLFYTGVSRESAAIVDQQSNNVKQHDATAIQALHEVKAEAVTMKECLLRGNIPELGRSMRKGWESKKRSADKISNDAIESVMASAYAAGAYAGKVSGAGGGGFIMFFVEPTRRLDIIRALDEFGGGQVFGCHFTKHGTQGWRIG
jgi:D-glycero-alpha-D-manno-heptose-7-phosphate kinase